MRIGIDARLIEETGVGRYIQNLIGKLSAIDTQNSYVVFLRKKSYDVFALPNSRWEKRLADAPWHTISEQLVMPVQFAKARLDIVHIPYHNPPILYGGRMVVTMHDLTILHENTGRATTLPMPFYVLKRLGYWLELAIGLRKAKKIIAVSETTRKEIIDHIGIPPDKIVVTYEGVDEKVHSSTFIVHSNNRLIKNPYFLYVGNAYPHKNLETLITAFRLLISKGIKLVLVGKEDYFYTRLKGFIKHLHVTDSIIFFGIANDQQLDQLYRHAIALVCPSKMEGFGLPGIEAMTAGTPVTASDIPVFREIYHEAFLPFNPRSPEDIADKLTMIKDDINLRKTLIERGKEQIKKYTWDTMADVTLSIYEEVGR